MTTPLENRSDASLYKQIYLTVRTRILNGEYPNNSVLPGEIEMSRQFGVSRITTKRALNELAAEGFCTRKRGVGTIVTFNPSTGPLQADVQGLLNFLSHVNEKTEGILLDLNYLPATSELAEIFRVAPGVEIRRIVRLRKLDGKPFSHLTTCIPGGIGRQIDSDDLGKEAALTLLERQGVKISSAEQNITATLADTFVAEALNVKLGSPLLRISRVVFDDSNRVVEYIVGLYRPDRFEYNMMLSRMTDKDGVNSWTSLG
ncbi:MAG: GntR family transcriptional regulator [Rhizobiaceae bacterium]